MGWRVVIKEPSGRIVYSHSYHTKYAAERAVSHTKWATGDIIKS